MSGPGKRKASVSAEDRGGTPRILLPFRSGRILSHVFSTAAWRWPLVSPPPGLGKFFARVALPAVLAMTVALPAQAQKEADYPEHIASELEAARLEREARIYKLRKELESLKGSEISLRIEKFKEVLDLLETDREIRALLKESPETYSLYKSVLGKRANIQYEDIIGDQTAGPDASSATRFCGCLNSTSVRWLGQNQQLGSVILAHDGTLHDLRVGDKMGGTLCYLRHADERKAILECRDPVEDKMLKATLSMQSMSQVQPTAADSLPSTDSSPGK